MATEVGVENRLMCSGDDQSVITAAARPLLPRFYIRVSPSNLGVLCVLTSIVWPPMSRHLYTCFRLLFGTLYPAYSSYKAVRTKNVKEYVKWMMYWIVFAFFTTIETFTDVFLGFWFPFYYEIKIVVVIWLLSPATKGSSILYRKFVHPMLTKREAEIDEYLSRAKEQGYQAVIQFGARGVNYATNMLMQTAIRGGGGLVNHLRRSYSVGDLGVITEGDVNRNNKALPGIPDLDQEEEEDIHTEPLDNRYLDQEDGGVVQRTNRQTRSKREKMETADLYFPEIDTDLRRQQSRIKEQETGLSYVRSSDDMSSGYFSSEPLYGSGMGKEALDGSKEPLVRTASVGSSRSKVKGTRSTTAQNISSTQSAAIFKRPAQGEVSHVEQSDEGDGDDTTPVIPPRKHQKVPAEMSRRESAKQVLEFSKEMALAVSDSSLPVQPMLTLPQQGPFYWPGLQEGYALPFPIVREGWGLPLPPSDSGISPYQFVMEGKTLLQQQQQHYYGNIPTNRLIWEGRALLEQQKNSNTLHRQLGGGSKEQPQLGGSSTPASQTSKDSDHSKQQEDKNSPSQKVNREGKAVAKQSHSNVPSSQIIKECRAILAHGASKLFPTKSKAQQDSSNIPPGQAKSHSKQEIINIPPSQSKALSKQEIGNVPTSQMKTPSKQENSNISAKQTIILSKQQGSSNIPLSQPKVIPDQESSSIPPTQTKVPLQQEIGNVPPSHSTAPPKQEIGNVPPSQSKMNQKQESSSSPPTTLQEGRAAMVPGGQG